MRRPALIAALSLAAVACAPAVQQLGPGRCKSSLECETGQICNANGFCQTALGCHVDSDCPANQSCNADAGSCFCTSNQGCGALQFCNTSGRCQDYGACQVNADCPPGDICDTINKNCIPAGECGGSIQCPLGQVCDATSSTCLAGCNNSGDCPQTAINDAGVTVFAPEGCINGQCKGQGACTETIGCPFGQECQGTTCVSACTGGTPFCAQCDPNNSDSSAPFGDPIDCGSDSNLCLDDPRNNANCMGVGGGCQYWCGIDCSAGQACPAGYDCSEVVVVTPGQSTCTCGSNDCGTGVVCQCDEGATSGYCPCQSDFDCNAPGVTCSDGNCIIGSSCFPVNGLYCNEPGQCP